MLTVRLSYCLCLLPDTSSAACSLQPACPAQLHLLLQLPGPRCCPPFSPAAPLDVLRMPSKPSRAARLGRQVHSCSSQGSSLCPSAGQALVPSIPQDIWGRIMTLSAAVMMGGITDRRGQGDKMYSTLHGDMYLFNMDTSRWFPLAVRAPNKRGATGAAPDQADPSSTPGECMGWPSK